MEHIKALVLIGLVSLFVGCGGSGGDGGSTDEQPSNEGTGESNNAAPQFISASVVNVNEGELSVMTLAASDSDGDTIDYSISGVDAELFNVDNASGELSFKETPDYESPADNGENNTYNFIATASDGVASVSTDVSISIHNIDDERPVFSSSNTAIVNENQTAAITLRATDIDSSEVRYSINNFDASLFEVDAISGVVTFKNAPDFEAPLDGGSDNVYNFNATASDGIQSTTLLSVSITVLDLSEGGSGGGSNTAPIFTSSATANINEGLITAITLMASDSDDDSITYSISGSDATRFNVNASTGVVTFKVAPDYESPVDANGDNTYTFIANADDGITSTQQSVSINVNNINDNPPSFISSATANVNEGQTTAITLMASDSDDDSIAYSISGSDATRFNINASTGVVTFKVAPDYESPVDANGDNTYTFIANADDGITSIQQSVSINVNNINDNPPSFISSATASVNEGQTTAITLMASDSDGNNNITYSISGTDAALFNLDASSGVVTFKSAPDFETPLDNGADNTYEFIATASDGSTDIQQSVSINVSNINDNAPTADAGSDQEVDTGTLVSLNGSASFDADDDSLTYYWSVASQPDDANITLIAHTTATPSFTPIVDGNYTIRLIVNDGSLSSTADTLTISATTLNVGPKLLQVAKTIAQDGAPSDYFGLSVAIDGDYVVAGAYGDDDKGSMSGSAYLFKRQSDNSLQQLAKLTADDGAKDDRFAYAVDISGDYIVVGAYGVGTNEGRAYLYKRLSDQSNDVIEVAKFAPTDSTSSGAFGYSVAIDGDYIVVGDPYESDETGSYFMGSAYLFKRQDDDSVTQLARLQADDSASENFGIKVAISGDYLVVGAHENDDLGTNSGAAYLFKRHSDTADNVTQLAKMTASDGEAEDRFGVSVAIEGDYIAIGASGDDLSKGSAYLFKRLSDTDVRELQKFTASDGIDGDKFGSSVSMYNNKIVVGASAGTGVSAGTGSAYLFQRNDDGSDLVIEKDKMSAADGQKADYFGRSVCIDGEYIVVGAFGDNDKGATSGSVSLFKTNVESGIYLLNAFKDFTVDESFQNVYVNTLYVSSYDNGPINFSLGGNDSSELTVNDEGELSFYGYPDYESPSDENVNNVYEVQITARAGDGESIAINSKIMVTDKKTLEIAKALAVDGAEGDSFGDSVAVDGNYIVIGTKGSESAYLFKRHANNTVSQIAKLSANDGAEGDYFGDSVAISGDYIVIGANRDSSGSAYLFKRYSDDIVSELAKFSPTDATGSLYFGTSVSIDGDYIIVGAYGEDRRTYDSSTGNTSVEFDTGSAYLFKRNSDQIGDVSQLAKLTASDAAEFDKFGANVAISGDYMVVGASGRDDMDTSSGAAYLFKRISDATDDVRQLSKLTVDEGSKYSYFGGSVAIDGDYIVVGAYGDLSYKGNAYLFKRNSDTTDDVARVAKLSASDGGSSDRFGSSVSIDGDTIIVGAYRDDINNALYAGSAYVFRRNSDTINDVTELEKMNASDAARDDYFGSSVAISGSLMVMGVDGDDDKGTDSGSAYIYELDP